MKIYHLSSAPFSGGAARAGFRLHQGLLRTQGIESIWLDPGTSAHGDGVVRLERKKRGDGPLMRMKRRYWGGIVRQHFDATTPPASNPVGWGGVDMLEKLPVPDVWNLHWVSWFLEWETMLPWMAEQAPIVWTLHDLNPLKGIWHYEPEESELTGTRRSFEHRALELKRRALKCVPSDRLTFVGPSRWMVECCERSLITSDFPVRHIPYGVDAEIFTPRDPGVLRKMFGIPLEDIVIGFVADNIEDPRKGMVPLLEALRILCENRSNIRLLAVGKGQLEAFDGLRYTHIGPIQNDLLLSYFYSSCDLFACPSLQDNFPNTVIEAMACGTPVTGYMVGGLPDMVGGSLGLLAHEVGCSRSLATAIGEALESTKTSPELVREKLRACCDLGIQGDAYAVLYAHMSSGRAEEPIRGDFRLPSTNGSQE